MIYSLKDSNMHGLCVAYYHNGIISDSGTWSLGRKNGLFAYFDSTGELEKIIEFIPFQDTALSRPNQIFKIGKHGDTLLNNESFYYEYWIQKDTIKYKKEDYVFKIVLRGHMFDNAFLKICDFDDKYNLLPSGKCDGVEMHNFEIISSLAPERYKIGQNTLRGVIVNYKKFKTKDDRDTMISASTFFSKNFYVVE